MNLTRRLLLTLFASLLIAPSLVAQTPARRAPATGAGQTRPSAPAPTPAAKGATAASTTKVTPAAANAPAASDECACEPGPLPEVLAMVNGIRITQADISPAVQQRIDQLKKEVIDARANELDLQINSLLLAAEAKKRGMTTSKLIEQEVIAKVKEPTDAEARAFYDQNKARIQAEFEQVKNDVVAYLREGRRREAAKQLADRLRASADVKKMVEKASAATASDRAKVLATVNGEGITSAVVEESLRPLVYAVQEQIFSLRKQDIDMRINDALLEQEAQRLKVTTQALLDAEVKSKLPVITEAEAQKFYNENKERINGDFAQLKYQIISYLEEQAAQRAQAAFAQRLRNASSVQTLITAPVAPVFDIATDDQPTKGNPSAAVTLVEFTDYQCPSCAQTHPAIERLAAEYGDRLRVVIRDFPLPQHENAFKAAEAAEAAREQGKYWEYITYLFKNQSALGVQNLKEFASAVGLDRARFDAALDSGKFTEKVQRDLTDGQKLGVNSTPSLFINGRRVNDRTYEGLKLIIEEALKAAPKK